MVAWYYLAGVIGIALICAIGWYIEGRTAYRMGRYIEVLESEFRLMWQNVAIFSAIEGVQQQLVGQMKSNMFGGSMNCSDEDK